MTPEGLSVRALYRLATMNSRLRHSVVEACFYNLRVLAQELPGRRGNGDFAKNLADALAGVATVRNLMNEYLAYEVEKGVLVADLFAEEQEAVAASLAVIESLATKGPPSREDQPACLEFAERVVQHVDHVLGAVDRIRAKTAEQRISVGELLESLAAMYAGACREAGVALTVEESDEGDLTVFGEREALLNALGELVKNAMRHAFPEGHAGAKEIVLRYRADPDTRDTMIWVCDNGQGMSGEQMAQVGTAGASTAGGGDGIAMVRRIVERDHIGLVTFENLPRGGTCARVRLPRRAEPGLESRDDEQAGAAAGAGTGAWRVVVAAVVLAAVLGTGLLGAWWVVANFKRGERLAPADRTADRGSKDKGPDQDAASGRIRIAGDVAGQYRSISEALAAAKSGATIEVAPGEYAERLLLDKAVTIVGSGEGEATLRSAEGWVVRSRAKGAVLRNLRIVLDGRVQAAAVVVEGGDLCLENCRVSSQGVSCIEVGGGAPTVRGCTIYNGRRNGIFVHDGGGGLFEKNSVLNCARSGIAVSDGANPLFRENTIRDCGQAGIKVYDRGRGIFERNEVTGCGLAAIGVKSGGDPIVRACKLHDNRDDGVLILGQGKGRFVDNEIWGNLGNAIVICAGGEPHFERNTVERNGSGLWIKAGAGGVVKGNRFAANTGGDLVDPKAATRIEGNRRGADEAGR